MDTAGTGTREAQHENEQRFSEFRRKVREAEVVDRIEARDDTDGKHGATKPKRAEADSAAERKLELKICERCGGLWLRPAGSRWVYCGPCKSKLDTLPPASDRVQAKRRGARM